MVWLYRPLIHVSVLQGTVHIDVSALRIRSTNYMQPYPRLYRIVRILKITSNAQAAIGIKDIKADPVVPPLGIVSAIHSEDPFVLARLTFSQPMHVTVLSTWKRKHFGPYPC